MSGKRKFHVSKRTLRDWIYAYIFLLPWLVGVVALVLYPLINSINFSFHNVRLPPTGMQLEYIGWKNFSDLFLLDTNFVQSLLSFLVDTLLQVPIVVSFSLIISILLNGKIRARGFFRAVFFLPVIIATGPVMSELVAEGVATVPMVNLSGVTTAVSNFLPRWMSEPIITLFSSLILILWNSGVQILIFLAGLQKVSGTLYEAAKIDGGSGWECFWKITIPTIRPMIFLNAVYTIIWFATSSSNGVIALIYNSMYASNRGYGYASAEAWIYSIVILLVLGVAWLLLHEKKDKPVKYVKRLERRYFR